MGGTEILQPLKDVLGAAGVRGYSRQVFVLTDGEVSNAGMRNAGMRWFAEADTMKVSNTSEVINYVARQAGSRVFALGLGEGASHELVEGIGKAAMHVELYTN